MIELPGGHIRQAHEIVNAQAVAATYEMRHHKDLTDQQKAYLMGMRCALAWVLALPKGGRKLEELMQGIPLNRSLPPLPVNEWLAESLRVQRGEV